MVRFTPKRVSITTAAPFVAFWALILLFVSTMPAQNVEKDSTLWQGEWRDEGNLQYGFKLRIWPLGGNKFAGVFEWKLIWTSLYEHKPKVGSIAKERVIGVYDPMTKKFNLVGIGQEDPADIISMDHYLINVSADGKRIEGINVKPENYHGSMFGVLVPKKKKAIAIAPPPVAPPTAKPTPSPKSSPAQSPTSPAPMASPPVIANVSAAKELNSREIVTRKELHGNDSQVRVKIFDESIIDGDVISLSWNGIWVLRYYRVAKLPKELILDLQKGENTLVMFAENLGKYPPNTAAITLLRGSKTEQFILNSDMGRSEAIKIVRD